MRNILKSSFLFIAASLLIGCGTFKKSNRGGYAAYENDQRIESELSAKIQELDLRLKKLEDEKDK